MTAGKTRTITIIVHDGNHFDVHEGERYCDRLCWDEMLGTIAELTHPKIGEARYRMRTPEEHQAWRDRTRRTRQESDLTKENTE